MTILKGFSPYETVAGTDGVTDKVAGKGPEVTALL